MQAVELQDPIVPQKFDFLGYALLLDASYTFTNHCLREK